MAPEPGVEVRLEDGVIVVSVPPTVIPVDRERIAATVERAVTEALRKFVERRRDDGDPLDG